ncbi:cytochrome c oxidase biogenesis protein Cmc1-like protein [Xylariaceae sp. FL0804]|nr:cytochrome c oxidase biogenesis protein Cmc1-like protein [Xylariaceae sp. FL0804]
MHPHLHRQDNIACEELMNALEECHEQGFISKAFGQCADIKHKMSMCLRAERLKRTAVNREAAKARRERVQKVWAEIDEES